MMHPLLYFYPQGHEGHYFENHPERPERIEAIRQSLANRGWWEKYPVVQDIDLDDEILFAVHNPEYLRLLKQRSQSGGQLDADTYLTGESWQLALQAAGGAVAVAEAVWLREAKRGFALTRPPGHHATPNHAMGFCLLNNVALAAEHLIQKCQAQRIAIVDIDLHHGNGTQEIFYSRDDVLFISTHQFPLYPGSGRMHEIGREKGEGVTVNLPLPPMSGDEAFRVTVNEVILPIIDQYSPEIILVSAGMDSHWRDPLGYLLLSAKAYGEIVMQLVKWADEKCEGKIALFLEGGYDLEGGSECAVASVAALLGNQYQDPIGISPWNENNAWKDVVAEAKQIWGI